MVGTWTKQPTCQESASHPQFLNSKEHSAYMLSVHSSNQNSGIKEPSPHFCRALANALWLSQASISETSLLSPSFESELFHPVPFLPIRPISHDISLLSMSFILLFPGPPRIPAKQYLKLSDCICFLMTFISKWQALMELYQVVTITSLFIFSTAQQSCTNFSSSSAKITLTSTTLFNLTHSDIPSPSAAYFLCHRGGGKSPSIHYKVVVQELPLPCLTKCVPKPVPVNWSSCLSTAV